MASTTALYTGLSGLNANGQALDVIGNNIANANTTAFKSSRVLFESMFSRTMSSGTAPGDATGGTNPDQVGLGVRLGATQRDLRNGSISTTGDNRDLAIEGEGYFIVRRADTTYYTRAGAFRTDAANNLVTPGGDRVQGFPVDDNFVVQTGQLTDISIPIGTLTIAEATTAVRFAGNLNADGQVATSGSLVSLLATETGGFSLIPGATVPATPPNALDTTSLLTEIEDPLQPGSGVSLFSAGQSLRIDGAEKGTKILPPASLDIGLASTIADLLDFLTSALGLATSLGPNPDGATPGVALDPAAGVINITGNTGTANDLDIESADIRLLDPDGTTAALPFITDKSAQATGESVRSTFVLYDSLGTSLTADLTMVLEEKSSGGTTWRYYAESPDDTDADLFLGSGTVMFDTAGQLATPDPAAITLDRAGTGADSPLRFDILFGGDDGNVTALADEESQLAAVFQDGSPLGTLTDYAVASDGSIVGTFSNAVTRTLGMVALADFANPAGLVDSGSGLFTVGANSGPAVVAEPLTLGTGRVVGGALELSNVDLGQEFINLILASTGYSASSRVIRTTDELMQQLLVLGS